LSVTGALYAWRPDLVAFVNGLPLVVIELKKPGVPARAAFDENLTSYKHPQNGIPALFVFNALLIASNGTDSRVGSLTADWERWVEWKRIEREDEPRRVSLEVMLRETCDKVRLLDFMLRIGPRTRDLLLGTATPNPNRCRRALGFDARPECRRRLRPWSLGGQSMG